MTKQEILSLRSHAVKRARQFFDERGFTEVQTPRLVRLPGQEPYLEPLWTDVKNIYHEVTPMALITSPEYAMKKLLGEGMEKIYDLGPCFRNQEPWDYSHDVEFLMVEWYHKKTTLVDLMNETEAMVRFVVQDAIPLAPFRKMTVEEAFKIYVNIDLSSLIGDREAMAQQAIRLGQTVDSSDSWDDLFHKIFLSHIEHRLGWNEEKTNYQPTFLYRYPATQAALAKRDPADTRYALRVELYIGDLELCNGFEELSDAEEQRKRFEEEISLRKQLGKNTWPIDERFLASLEKMGQCSGNAFGIDRLVMLMTKVNTLAEIMPIPLTER